jgi:hypothetical protein
MFEELILPVFNETRNLTNYAFEYAKESCFIKKSKENYDLDLHCLREEGIISIKKMWSDIAIAIIIIYLLRFVLWKVMKYFPDYEGLLLQISRILGIVAEGTGIFLALMVLYFRMV